MSIQKEVIKNCKHLIDIYDLIELKKYYTELMTTNFDYDINFSYIYKDVFFYACNKENKDVIHWLIQLYHSFDDVTKIALRQMFTYGKYILIRKKNSQLANWYETNVLKPIKCS